MLGIDETRFRTVRWILDGITWTRSDPWLTSFVDCSPDGPGSLLGLAPGRTGSCVREWLAEQTPQFRDAIATVVIDPSAPYASGIRPALPGAVIAVDKWHLVAHAHTMVTEVRQRVTREQLGRRGTTKDPVWVNRRMLLTGAEHLSAKQRDRLWKGFDERNDPTQEILAAWAVKERLRMLLSQSEPSKIRWALADFYDTVIDARLPQATRLAGTIERWWPAVLVALTTGITNARTEGFNRIIKQTKRVGCGFRNMINYQRRILTYIAVTDHDGQQHESEAPRSNSGSPVVRGQGRESTAGRPARSTTAGSGWLGPACRRSLSPMTATPARGWGALLIPWPLGRKDPLPLRAERSSWLLELARRLQMQQSKPRCR